MLALDRRVDRSQRLADTSGFLRQAFTANAVLMTVGFILVGYQVAGYFVAA